MLRRGWILGVEAIEFASDESLDLDLWPLFSEVEKCFEVILFVAGVVLGAGLALLARKRDEVDIVVYLIMIVVSNKEMIMAV